MQRSIHPASNRTITKGSDTDISSTKLRESHTPLIDHFIGRYRLIGDIGSTNRSVVYLGEAGSQHRAFKFSISPNSKTHPLKSEFEIGKSMESPRIVSFHRYGTYRGLDFIEMELLSPRHLGDAVGEVDSDLRTALRLFGMTLDGVEAVHSGGVLHLDLKPGNIMLDRSGGIKIIDFSHSVRTGPSGRVKLDTVALGTPGYMAPEVFDGALDRRTDLFSVGSALFAALTGEDPFGACLSSSETKIFHSRDKGPEHLGRKRPDLPGILVDAIMHALNKDPNKRFQTTAEFRAAIKDCADRCGIEM